MGTSVSSIRIGDEKGLFPAWIAYLMGIGASYAKSQASDLNRLVLSVPSRYLVAPFLALGYISEKFQLSAQSSNDKHFQALCALNLLDPVTVIEKNKKYQGVFAGVETRNDKLYVKVLLALKDMRKIFYGEEDAHKIIISNRSTTEVPKLQVGRKLQINKDFLKIILGKEDAVNAFVTETQLFCEILGHVNELGKEIEETEITILEDQLPRTGKLQDVLRVKGLLGLDYGCHTELLSANKNCDTESKHPGLVMFDGALAFLKWKNFRKESSWIVILDRTDRLFQDAAALVKSEFITSRKGENQLRLAQPITGIEVLEYFE